MFSPKFRWSTCTGHKIYRQQNVSRVNCSFEGLTLRRFFSTLHVLDSPLSNNAWFSVPNWTSSFRSACLRLCCCFHHLRSKKTVLLKPSLQTVAINHIKETSHLIKNAAHIPRFHWNNCEKRQMDRVKNDSDCPAIARDKKTGLADQSYLSRRNFIQTCLKKYDSLMVKKTKLYGLPMFGSFWNWGSHLFCATCWHISYTNKIGSSATWSQHYDPLWHNWRKRATKMHETQSQKSHMHSIGSLKFWRSFLFSVRLNFFCTKGLQHQVNDLRPRHSCVDSLSPVHTLCNPRD